MKFQILFAFFVLVATPAFAGFNWIPGAGGDASSGGDMSYGSPAVPAMPVPPVASGPLTPDPSYNDMPMAGNAVQNYAPMDYTPPVMSPTMSPNVVQGFGKAIPLAVALPQILPAGKGFSFAPSVNPDLKISWQGGRAWQETLQTSLSQHGLSYADNGGSVEINKGGHGGGNLGMSLPLAQNVSAPSGDTKQRLFAAPATYAAAPGQSLSQVLALWAQQQNVKFLWRAPRDYTVSQGVSMNASFDRAVENIMSRYQNMSPQPVATLYPNLPNGPAVLVVQ